MVHLTLKGVILYASPMMCEELCFLRGIELFKVVICIRQNLNIRTLYNTGCKLVQITTSREKGQSVQENV